MTILDAAIPARLIAGPDILPEDRPPGQADPAKPRRLDSPRSAV